MKARRTIFAVANSGMQVRLGRQGG